MTDVAVIGLGPIGLSLAEATRDAFSGAEIVGFDPDKGRLHRAQESGVLDAVTDRLCGDGERRQKEHEREPHGVVITSAAPKREEGRARGRRQRRAGRAGALAPQFRPRVHGAVLGQCILPKYSTLNHYRTRNRLP